MENRWSEAEAAEFSARYREQWGEDLALRTYSSRLIGAEEDLVLHGGGNTSVKTTAKNIFEETIPALYVKASGYDLRSMDPEGHSGLDHEYLKRLLLLPGLSDEAMLRELHAHLLDSRSASPSIETLVHAILPQKFIDHTHADAIVALTNQTQGEKRVAEALGEDVLVLGYVHPGFELAKAVGSAFAVHPDCRAMVWMRHGLVTWGDTARQSYAAMIELVSKAEAYLERKAKRPIVVQVPTPARVAQERWARLAPVLRGLLATRTGNPDRPYRRLILQSLQEPAVLQLLGTERFKKLALTPPLTADHLIRTKPLPLWVDRPDYEDPGRFRDQLQRAIQEYREQYDAYVDRHAARLPEGVERFDSMPAVLLLPGLGAVCAGKDIRAAKIARDITAHTLQAKARIAAMDHYQGLAEDAIFAMEYRSLQHAKLGGHRERPLGRCVGLITGAAGAIGSALAQELLEQGCHVAVTDLGGERLDGLVKELQQTFGDRVMGVSLDVTDPASVARTFRRVSENWGGVDLVVANAGVAQVSSLEEIELSAFHRVSRVNTEGTLLLLGESSRHFRLQSTGGDVVLISTKNVFAPGAKFGAYSATKAAAHQLARIASLELAPFDVRVNMVAPDAVFSHGERKSGLWVEVGPDRMRARGLDAAGLEDYYRNRNLIKARVTATHVAKAVLFFAMRQTPTTGATLPVDGGLPDATPR